MPRTSRMEAPGELVAHPNPAAARCYIRGLMTKHEQPLRAILFDLGRVVVDIDFDRSIAHWARHSHLPVHELKALWQPDDAYQRHETGELSDEGYFAYLKERLGLDCSLQEVALGWNALLSREIEETLAMVDAIRDRVPCYAISNTNECHLQHMHSAFPRMLPRFEKVFVSHRIGHRKPHAEAFLHVLREIGVAPAEALLFDDLPPNVEGARACGLAAVLVRGPHDVREELVRRGLLAGPA
jgi:FMN phosphatase YigB (HAD superfamily)